MLVKYIDENTIENAPRVIFDKDKVYANPTEETLREHGYLPFEDSDSPDEAGYYFTFRYETDGKKVCKVWDSHEIIEEEPVEDSECGEPEEKSNEGSNVDIEAE